jgi:hypothetical protein
MDSLVETFKNTSGSGYDANTFYLFLLNHCAAPVKNAIMPFNQNFGFIFTDNPGASVERTIAHELGHGAFGLLHTFRTYGNEPQLDSAKTDNLMDYADGTHLFKYQWDEIHEPVCYTETCFGTGTTGEDVSMVNIAKLLADIRKANQEESPTFDVVQDQCPHVCYKNVKIGDKKLSYLQISCSEKFEKGEIDENLKSEIVGWQPSFGQNVIIQPSEKSQVFQETNKGQVVYYQYHQLKENALPLKDEMTTNFLFEFAVLQDDASNFEEYLYHAPYKIKKISFYCQTDAAISGLDCRWCSNWSACCNGDIDGIKDKKGKMTCADGTKYGKNNCCYETSRFMVTQFGKTVGTRRAYIVNLTNVNDLRDGVTPSINLTDNNDIIKVKTLIKDNTPVIAGVFYSGLYEDNTNIVDPKNHKVDGTTSPTCHFIVLVGYGTNKDGAEYFIFYDPASKTNGTSDYNILTINIGENLIKGKLFNDTKKSYILTEFRLP